MTDAATLEASVDEMMSRRGQPGGAMAGVEYPFPNNQWLANFVRFHHPDGTHSDLAAPTYNPKKPTPYLERFLVSKMKKLGPNKGRWFFLERQAPAPELPIRCFVEGCPRAGGFSNNRHLWQHVMSKHGEESHLYGNILDALKKQTQADLDPEMLKQLGLGPTLEAKAATAGPQVFTCTVGGCERFFDTEQGRKLHEREGHK
jgi:hypothetical protein